MLFAMSVKMMLDWMGYKEAGKAIEDAVYKVLEEGKILTYDLGGTAKCSEVFELYTFFKQILSCRAILRYASCRRYMVR